MGDIQEILVQYGELRHQGMDVRTALDSLRTIIDVLDEGDRLDLAHRIRAQETSSAKSSGSMRRIDKTEMAHTNDDRPVCPHCGKRNRADDRLCYACGQLLLGPDDTYQTRILGDEDEAARDDYFGQDSVLILTARNSSQVYRIHPQHSERELVLGRSTNRGPMMPDIDLSDSDGNRLGVSRLHLSVRYDTQDHTLTIFDLGSANGTFVNGQRLHPHEVRVLRHNDELRLGNMIMVVTFQHSATV